MKKTINYKGIEAEIIINLFSNKNNNSDGVLVHTISIKSKNYNRKHQIPEKASIEDYVAQIEQNFKEHIDEEAQPNETNILEKKLVSMGFTKIN